MTDLERKELKEKITLKTTNLLALRNRKKSVEKAEKELSKELKELVESLHPDTSKITIESRVGDVMVSLTKTTVESWGLVSDAPTFIRNKVKSRELVDRLIIVNETVDKAAFEMALKDGEIDADFASSIITQSSYEKLIPSAKKYEPEEDYENGFD